MTAVVGIWGDGGRWVGAVVNRSCDQWPHTSIQDCAGTQELAAIKELAAIRPPTAINYSKLWEERSRTAARTAINDRIHSLTRVTLTHILLKTDIF